MKKIVLTVVLLIGITVFGQNQQFIDNINIKTPEVSSLFKFENYNVDNSTGLLNLSFPIYNIKEGQINYPIELKYNSSGVLVQERSSWVGHNFSVMQSQVTRSIKGIPDEGNFGYIADNKIDVKNTYYSTYSRANYNGQYDTEPDEFNVILPSGESIKFYFTQETSLEEPYGQIIQVPLSKNKIKPTINNSIILSWEITTADGFVYLFEKSNNIQTSISFISDQYNLPIASGSGSGSANYTSSWLLKQIKSPNGDSLQFDYTYHTYVDCIYLDESKSYGVTHTSQGQNNFPSFQETESITYVENSGINFLLNSITGNFGKVEFILSNEIREDFLYGKKLEEIRVSNSVNELI